MACVDEASHRPYGGAGLGRCSHSSIQQTHKKAVDVLDGLHSIEHHEGSSTLSTGIIATAIVLIIGYVIVSRIVGLAFRLVVPLVLLLVLGGAGMFSGLMPERSPAGQYSPYEQAQHHPSGDVGDLRLRDIADMTADAFRSVLRGSLALLNGVSEPEPRREPRWPDEPQHTRRGEPYEPSPEFDQDPRENGVRRGW